MVGREQRKQPERPERPRLPSRGLAGRAGAHQRPWPFRGPRSGPPSRQRAGQCPREPAPKQRHLPAAAPPLGGHVGRVVPATFRISEAPGALCRECGRRSRCGCRLQCAWRCVGWPTECRHRHCPFPQYEGQHRCVHSGRHQTLSFARRGAMAPGHDEEVAYFGSGCGKARGARVRRGGGGTPGRPLHTQAIVWRSQAVRPLFACQLRRGGAHPGAAGIVRRRSRVLADAGGCAAGRLSARDAFADWLAVGRPGQPRRRGGGLALASCAVGPTRAEANESSQPLADRTPAAGRGGWRSD
mmetsp:Transcript_19513/g.63569  ORF Transcript_19513/g.63569 Transcript_19513/m.63569 type:complete len:299 (-) Transcript_19513:862-1758(-)